MSFDVYQFDIARTDKATDLHHFQAEINADEALTSDERDLLSNQIREKFCSLNRAAAGPQKPRWK